MRFAIATAVLAASYFSPVVPLLSSSTTVESTESNNNHHNNEKKKESLLEMATTAVVVGHHHHHNNNDNDRRRRLLLLLGGSSGDVKKNKGRHRHLQQQQKNKRRRKFLLQKKKKKVGKQQQGDESSLSLLSSSNLLLLKNKECDYPPQKMISSSSSSAVETAGTGGEGREGVGGTTTTTTVAAAAAAASAADADADADMGILGYDHDYYDDTSPASSLSSSSSYCSSSPNYYCMESHTSSRGGICVEKRSNTKKKKRITTGKKQKQQAQYITRSSSGSQQQQQQQRKLQSCDETTSDTCPYGKFCNYEFGLQQGGFCTVCPCDDPNEVCVDLLDTGILTNNQGVLHCIEQCAGIDDTSQLDDCGEHSITDNSYYCYYSYDFIANVTGTKYCYTDLYCSYGCCYSFSYQETIIDSTTGYKSDSFSYYFKTPYEQNFTMYSNSNSICQIIVNGEYCTACSYDPNTQCVEFDCTNIRSPDGNNIIGESGNTCGDEDNDDDRSHPIPIYNECFLEGHGCNICGHTGYSTNHQHFGSDGSTTAGLGQKLLYPSTTVYIPNHGLNNCYDIYYAGLYRLFGDNGSEDCVDVSKIAGHKCCADIEFTGCNICDGGDPQQQQQQQQQQHVLVNPLEEVPFTNKQCQEFYFDGLLGNIDPLDCPSITTQAGPICCGELQITPAPSSEGPQPPVVPPPSIVPPITDPRPPPPTTTDAPIVPPIPSVPPVIDGGGSNPSFQPTPPKGTLPGSGTGPPFVPPVSPPPPTPTEESAGSSSPTSNFISLIGISLSLAIFLVTMSTA